jgi:hypothetical protein
LNLGSIAFRVFDAFELGSVARACLPRRVCGVASSERCCFTSSATPETPACLDLSSRFSSYQHLAGNKNISDKITYR